MDVGKCREKKVDVFLQKTLTPSIFFIVVARTPTCAEYAFSRPHLTLSHLRAHAHVRARVCAHFLCRGCWLNQHPLEKKYGKPF
jgi:hypothetical protein